MLLFLIMSTVYKLLKCNNSSVAAARRKGDLISEHAIRVTLNKAIVNERIEPLHFDDSDDV